jgi:flagellar biosynthesis chaperone FliJ
MTADKKKLARLNRLEKLRAIAKQTAATEAAQAESTLAQLKMLSDRTRGLARDYAARRDAGDGAALHHVGRFVGGLQALTRTTDGDALRARSIADAKQQALVEAERRRAAIEDRADLQARRIASKAQPPVLTGRRASGTDLE